MELFLPDIGLIFWTLLIFLIVFFILKKFAWKPIMGALHEREQTIEESLRSAERAREEMAQLHSTHQDLLIEAKEERGKILREAKLVKEEIIAEAKEKARKEADRIVMLAKEEINNEKMAAVIDVKNQIANLSIEITEKVLKKQLANKDEQKAFVQELLKEVDWN